MPQPLDPKHQRAVSFAVSAAEPIPKNPPGRNTAYRELAAGKEWQLRVPYVCNHDPATTVLAHSNWGKHGKGMGMKAADAFGVWSCYACHTWLDQGKAISAIKELAFERALVRMRVELHRLLEDPATKARDREAAAWALERLEV